MSPLLSFALSGLAVAGLAVAAPAAPFHPFETPDTASAVARVAPVPPATVTPDSGAGATATSAGAVRLVAAQPVTEGLTVYRALLPGLTSPDGTGQAADQSVGQRDGTGHQARHRTHHRTQHQSRHHRRHRAERRAQRQAQREAHRKAAERAQRRAERAAERARRNPPVLAPFTVASLNALGASHTDGAHPQRRGWADSAVRMGWAVRLLDRHRVDVVGLQEFQPKQAQAFTRLAGGTYGVQVVGANAVAWRKSEFSFVSATTLTVPYFGGHPTPQPVVTLRSTMTGQDMVFLSVHNPADARGPAQRWRDIAVAKESDYIQSLRATTNPNPVFLLGDMNDRQAFFCPITASGDMHAAAGGSHTDATGCVYPPAATAVDWVLGSTGVKFTGFQVDRSPLVGKTTDHPMIVAHVG